MAARIAVFPHFPDELMARFERNIEVCGDSGGSQE
jgi:hypothetical protein